MAIRVALHHQTVYRYDRLVTLGPQTIRLRPAPHSRTPVPSYSLKVEPADHFLNWQQDPQGNYLARAVFTKPTQRLSVTVDLVAELAAINPFDYFLEPNATQFPFQYEPELARELRPFLECLPVGPKLREWLSEVDRSKRETNGFLMAINGRVRGDVGYTIRLEPGVQTPEETLIKGTGSCRDSAWLLVQILRNLGLAARFCSGYLIQLRADVPSLDGPSGPEQDFTDLHAWTEVYLPGAGWVGLDPTSGLFAAEGHIPLAATPDPSGAAPISGCLDECEVEFDHAMRVTRVREEPRVTLPYTDEQWARIEKLGHRIDAQLREGDVRLTMGGEPTFVSIDDMDGPEWNIAAMGPNKRRLASQLFLKLRDRFAPGGLLHYGQGKWYPGESLPRWAFSCYWRKDGQPIWMNPHLIADDNRDYGFQAAHAAQFARALATRLGVSPHYARPAYEDPWHFLQKEQQLPVNVDPLDNRLEEAEERERLRRVFERGLNTPVGYVLPIQRGTGKRGPEWQTGLWMLRSQHLILIPGDSPIGLRLPLASLPWVTPEQYPRVDPLDPAYPRAPLPAFDRQQRLAVEREPLRASPAVAEQVLPDRVPQPGESAGWVVRTAMCVEARKGRLHVFMPPLTTAEDYLELVAAIEDTAAQLAMPVQLEGYTPPIDPRLNLIKVTPDPGVIEVNVHPASSWDELVANTVGLYDDARVGRLGTEKFMLDGRHTGTGGGNHVVLGGPTPLDSPFLRRPDLLRSLIAYWMNHPSLSYLFAGAFVGPTSQAPRVDEARQDSVYELEIAFRALPEPGGYIPPWLIDRVFRNLLVDATGNTHRAEFCIDKLYAPETSTGRLGLVELRAFEMPPHARMSLAQQLLVRALVSWFWKQPYKAKPIEWGTQLHDRYLLPYFVEQDLADVLNDLNDAGYAFEHEWFAPHREFRFPRYGLAHYQGIDIELRQAIEPWNVLGEEPGAGGTVRYVDTSLERLQVRVNGLVSERYVVACNGRRVPLVATGVRGEYVAGVRYRAWQPPSCLHPLIPVHAPLVIDLIDRWSERAVAGCTYYVAHPGGRGYELFPVNALEAEGRRLSRFQPFGHTPGPASVPPEERNPAFPTTLDLRREHRPG